MEYRTGDVIGAYRLLAQCGSGSFGQVFLAENLFSGQTVALKLLTGTGKAMQKELDGLIRFRSCRHPNLLPILHIDKVDNHLYYTMPPADNLTPGEGYSADTLAHRLSSRGPLPASEVMAMTVELLAAFQEMDAALGGAAGNVLSITYDDYSDNPVLGANKSSHSFYIEMREGVWVWIINPFEGIEEKIASAMNRYLALNDAERTRGYITAANAEESADYTAETPSFLDRVH